MTNLTQLTKDLQSKITTEAEDKKQNARKKWEAIKESYPQANFVELINEIMGAPKAIRLSVEGNVVYGAGKFSPKKDMTVNLIGDYSWMDKPRKPKIFSKKEHY
jgi:hypothetical protein